MAKKVLICLALPLILGVGCRKKDRLSTNTYEFFVSPPATSILKGNIQTFTAEGRAPTGNFSTQPTWSILPSGASLNTSVGPSVNVTFNSSGFYRLTANFEEKTAEAQIACQNANTFFVYNDNGIPTGSAIQAGSLTLVPETIYSDAPEGLKYQKATDVTGGGFWYVDLGAPTLNLSNFPGGVLKFWIRKSRPLTAEVLRIDMDQDGAAGGESFVTTALAGNWQGYTTGSTDWQEVSIDLSRFYGGAGFVQRPFIFSKPSAGAAMTIDIDYIRLEN